ncbi:hypothetical protein SDC9_212046 [bioreactor metagenome]|uniref:Uncharacterized protein n=1 Tax=bioreactor metagenome TaxID=1076179 RepID=A0A645JKT0_9ZZZZ
MGFKNTVEQSAHGKIARVQHNGAVGAVFLNQGRQPGVAAHGGAAIGSIRHVVGQDIGVEVMGKEHPELPLISIFCSGRQRGGCQPKQAESQKQKNCGHTFDFHRKIPLIMDCFPFVGVFIIHLY